MPRLPGRLLMMEQLVAAGVRHVFGNPGTTEQAFMDALHDYPQVQYVLGLQEAAVLGMADGYSRLSPVPAFVELHIAPGLGNAMGMLYNAWRTHAPMVIYAGQHSQRGLLQEPILAGDLVSMARPLTKWAVEVQDAADLPLVLRRAFKAAMDPPRGPVLVSVPANIMDEEAEADVLAPVYLRQRARPEREALEVAAEMLARAEAPVIIAGDEVATAGAREEVERLAEMLGARLYASYGVYVPLATDHPCYAGPLNVLSGPGLRGQLAGADMVLAVGAPLFLTVSPVTENPLPAGCRLVHIGLDAWELGKNWPADLLLLADPGEALRELRALLEGRLTPAQREAAAARLAAAQGQRMAIFQALDGALRARWGDEPMAASRFAYELGQALHPDTVLFDESVTAGGHLMRHLRLRPGSHLRAAGGGLGAGIPAPIGLKLARPDRPVLGVVGDGAALYTVQALWTAAHYRVPVTWVIANNRSYRILKLNLLQYLGEGASDRGFIAMDLVEPELDFARIAEAFGVRGVRIERADELGPAVRQAQEAQEPWLIDVVIDGSLKGGFL